MHDKLKLIYHVIVAVIYLFVQALPSCRATDGITPLLCAGWFDCEEIYFFEKRQYIFATTF